MSFGWNFTFEQRSVIKFNAKIGKNVSDTFQLMQKVYGECCLSRSSVFLWHKRFLDGRQSLEDEKHTGRPISSRTMDIIEKVHNFIEKNCCASLRLMESSLDINKEAIRSILHDNLGKTKVCAKFVPHTLTIEQKSKRSAHCKDIISDFENDPNFIKLIVTGEET